MVLHGNIKDKGFTTDDVRYTQKDQNIYAFLMEWEDGKETLSLSALGSENRVINDVIKNVSIMGYDAEINLI